MSVKSPSWKVVVAKKGGVKMRMEGEVEKDGGKVVRGETQSLDKESLLGRRCSGELLYDVSVLVHLLAF
jgi:hypothetical protein